MSQSGLTSVISIIGLVIAGCSLFVPTIDRAEGNKKKKMIQIMIAGAAVIVIASGGFISNYDFKAEEVTKVELAETAISEVDLLEKAEKYYKSENYGEVLKIYLDSRLDTNPIALTNLGFMYENGIEVKKNLGKARSYYRKAANMENPEAIENYVTFTIMYPRYYNEVLDVLNYGKMHNSKTVRDFVLTNCELIDKNESERESFFWGLPEYEQEDWLDDNTYDITCGEEELAGLEKGEFIELKEENYASRNKVIGRLHEAQEDGRYSIETLTISEHILIPTYSVKKLLYDLDINTSFIYLK